jgi:transposase
MGHDARITKQGDQYLKTLLVHGARTVLMNAANRPGRINQWVTQLIARRGFKKACIAMAAKNARIIWATSPDASRRPATVSSASSRLGLKH